MKAWSARLSLLLLGLAGGLYFADSIPLEAAITDLPWALPTPDQVVQERIVDVPEDGQRWWTCIFTAETPTVQEQRVLAAFEKDSQLKLLKAQTKCVHYVPGDRYYETVLSQSIAEIPAVIVQKNDGKVIYKRSGQSLLDNVDRLGADIALAIEQCCPRPRPKPTPTPEPKPDATPAPAPAPIPDLTPNEPDETDPLALVLALIGGGLGGAGYSARKEM